MLTFISGWAGWPNLYPLISQKGNFVVPFEDLWPRDFPQFFQQNQFHLLIAWSTGAHLCLKYLKAIKSEYLFLIAPFKDFSQHISPLWLQKTKQNLLQNPSFTLHKFYKRIGVNLNFSPTPSQVENLAKGLNFLLTSRLTELSKPQNIKHLYLLYGQRDKLISAEEITRLAAELELGQGEVILLDQGHFLPQEQLLHVLEEKTNCCCF
ncbi:MAG: hypothetical protein PWR24_1845 [Desulfonauticus sp.]|jgi:hypothetical protein|nr:hypothetical protein [Desulfonauticus sp.]